MDNETGLPLKWRMVKDNATSCYYYFDITKNNYYPYLPDEVISSIPLPPGWSINFDPKTRRIFYKDFNTRTTQWQYPYDKLHQKPPPPPPHSPLINNTTEATNDPPVQKQENDDKDSIAVPPDTQEDEKREDDQNDDDDACKYVCIGCKKSEMNSVFVPCTHMCMCADCAKETRICPLCKNEIHGFNKFYAIH